ncbi:IS66 family insertion sequence element accessory protein TnpA [Anaerovorax odorimutans]
MKEQQESGMSISAWCRLNGIKKSTYYNRLNKVV